MIRNSEQFDNVDYIVRLRLDTTIETDIRSLITKLETNSNLQIILGWDLVAIGKPEIMDCYCTGLENNYGNYHYNVIIPKELPVMKDYHTIDQKRWTYAPERQLFEMLFEYCNNNNLDINNAISNGISAIIIRKDKCLKCYLNMAIIIILILIMQFQMGYLLSL